MFYIEILRFDFGTFRFYIREILVAELSTQSMVTSEGKRCYNAKNSAVQTHISPIVVLVSGSLLSEFQPNPLCSSLPLFKVRLTRFQIRKQMVTVVNAPQPKPRTSGGSRLRSPYKETRAFHFYRKNSLCAR